MPIKLIGKSVLGELGFCQVPSKMGENFGKQLEKIQSALLPDGFFPGSVCMTSMTNKNEINLTNGQYFPKIRKYSSFNAFMKPRRSYMLCELGLDEVSPKCDFIIWNSCKDNIVVTTFSREAPILAFESSNGKKALGVILRPSLMQYGDYLFQTISEYLQDKITVTLVTCNHYVYPEGSIPSYISFLASKYGMKCIIPENSDSEKNPECYHRGEEGNHVVAMW